MTDEEKKPSEGQDCEDCNGTGADFSFTMNPLEMPDGRDCPTCKGTGKVNPPSAK